MATMNDLNGHVIGESKRHGVCGHCSARDAFSHPMALKQNGDINKLYSNATSVINDADIGEWVKRTFTSQQVLVEILDYYQDVRDAGRHNYSRRDQPLQEIARKASRSLPGCG